MKKSLLAACLLASTALVACGNSDTATTTATTTESTTMTANATANSSSTMPGEATPASNNDAFFALESARTAGGSDGVIINIEKKSAARTYEVSMVKGTTITTYLVGPDSVMEQKVENDIPDANEAAKATVRIDDAITEVLNRHADMLLDEAELDEEDGQLVWQVKLTDAKGTTVKEHVPAA